MRTCLAAAAVLSAAAGSAQADLIRLTMAGPVETSNMTAMPVGTMLTVTLVYESSGPYQSLMNQQAFYANHIRSISIVGGSYSTSGTGNFGQINLYDNLSNTDGVQFQVAANAATYQFSSSNGMPLDPLVNNGTPYPFQNMFMNLASSSNAVWSGHSLPTQYDFSQFNATRNMTFAYTFGSFGVGFANCEYENLSVPAPASAALLGVLGVFASRRRR